MSWRGEVEDGSGWGWLVPSKAEREAERAKRSGRSRYMAMETALLRIAAYPKTPSDELSAAGARDIARAALAFVRGAT